MLRLSELCRGSLDTEGWTDIGSGRSSTGVDMLGSGCVYQTRVLYSMAVYEGILLCPDTASSAHVCRRCVLEGLWLMGEGREECPALGFCSSCCCARVWCCQRSKQRRASK